MQADLQLSVKYVILKLGEDTGLAGDTYRYFCDLGYVCTYTPIHTHKHIHLGTFICTLCIHVYLCEHNYTFGSHQQYLKAPE